MTTKIKLNKAYQKKNGTYPLILRITHNRKTFRINLDYDCLEKDWDKDKEKFQKSYPDARKGNEYLIFIKNRTIETFNKIRNSNKPFSKELFKKHFKGEDAQTTFFSFSNELINEFEHQGKISNRDIYTVLKNRVFEFSKKNTQLMFSDIDHNFLKKFETFLFQNDNTAGGVHHHMRTLRSIYNKAIDRGHVTESLYPFSTNRKGGYSLSHLKSNAKPRPLSLKDIERFKSIDVIEQPKLMSAKMYFLFSYYVSGMNLKDIAQLEKSDLYDGRIVYARSKTSRIFNVKITEKIQDILDYFSNDSAETKFVFPILSEFHQSEQQISDRVRKVRRKINASLKAINKILDIDIGLTMYVARHTFASVAKKKGISTDKISQALGHSSVKVTKAYLSNFEDDEMDKIGDLL